MPMTEPTDPDLIEALKVAFCFMPKLIDVTSYEYGERADIVTGQIDFVRGVLLAHDIDPDEVFDEINPDQAPNSSY